MLKIYDVEELTYVVQGWMSFWSTRAGRPDSFGAEFVDDRELEKGEPRTT